MTVTSVVERPDILRMDDPSLEDLHAAIEWLTGDPGHRAIVAPTELSAVLDMYTARNIHPESIFTREQFLVTGQVFPPGIQTRYVGFLGYFFV